jgi:hypothetical protein
MPTYLPPGLASFDRGADQEFDRRVAFVEAGGDQGGVPVQPESELGQVIGADREAVEVVHERVGDDGIGRQLTHHDHLKVIFASAKAVRGQQGDDPFSFCNGPNERNHDLDIGEAHLVADIAERVTLHGEAINKVR